MDLRVRPFQSQGRPQRTSALWVTSKRLLEDESRQDQGQSGKEQDEAVHFPLFHKILRVPEHVKVEEIILIAPGENKASEDNQEVSEHRYHMPPLFIP
jgi:hypothetical protein